MRTLLAAVLIFGSLPASADLKIVTRKSTGKGQYNFVETTYVQGKRVRSESAMGGRTIKILRCDLDQSIELNLKDRLYAVTALGPDGFPLNRPKFPGAYNGPTYNYTITTEDTGERSTIFGLPAWHVRETRVTSRPSPSPNKVVIDFWYVDLNVPNGCFKQDLEAYYLSQNPRMKVVRIGEAKRGFPVLTRTSGPGVGGKPFEYVVEVTELSTVSLDPQLFEIPRDFQPALQVNGRTFLEVPDTPANRLKATWDGFWVSLAKFIY
jgi:hypothetical protein